MYRYCALQGTPPRSITARMQTPAARDMTIGSPRFARNSISRTYPAARTSVCNGSRALRPERIAASAVAHHTSTVPMQKITSVRQILDQFQAVLLDQFGVLHDGQKPYPHAIAAVEQLHAAGKQIVILSNSSRRSGGTIGKLAKMGFREDWFAGAITSGELAHRYLASRPTKWWHQLGRKCIHFTWSSRGAISLDGLDLQTVDDPAQADFILAHGTEAVALPGGGSQDLSLQEMEQLLQRCAEQNRQLPMIVANPDLVTVNGASLVTMPGTLAHYYSQRGGQVQLMGKPDPIIYNAARELLPGAAADPQQWLAIGDSLEHDIAGAVQAGMKTLFVVGGIHREAAGLQGSPSEGCSCSWDEGALQHLCQQHQLVPDYCMAYLQK